MPDKLTMPPWWNISKAMADAGRPLFPGEVARILAEYQALLYAFHDLQEERGQRAYFLRYHYANVSYKGGDCTLGQANEIFGQIRSSFLDEHELRLVTLESYVGSVVRSAARADFPELGDAEHS